MTDINESGKDSSLRTVLWVFFAVVVFVVGCSIGTRPKNEGRTRAQEIREGCAREFPDPREQADCVLVIMVKELEEDRRKRLERAAE